MRVMTWNIRHGLGNDREVDLERIATVIETCEPDLVGLQEVDRHWSRSGSVDQTTWLAHRLAMTGVFGSNLVLAEGGEYGTAILSRHPILSWANDLLPSASGSESRGRLHAWIAIPNSVDMLFECTHLHWGGHQPPDEGIAERHDQTTVLASVGRPANMPVVLLGDFNAKPDASELDPLRRVFTDGWSAVHDSEPGFTIPTHPTDPPDRRIDYIWLSAGIRCLSIDVVDTPASRMASDHYPVMAEIRLPGS